MTVIYSQKTFKDGTVVQAICDSTTDMYNIDTEPLILGSTAFLPNGAAYMLNGAKQWTSISTGSSGGTGGTGADGKSAYEIALDNGFVGTESQWLVSLQGKPSIINNDGMWEIYNPLTEVYEVTTISAIGEKGEQGETGVAGIDGKDGADGINGTNGADGKDGKDGIDGTSFTFEDLTDEQKESLKGEKGDTGETGADGINGTNGTDGADGADGANGIDGKDGKDGLTTSVELNGTEYTQVEGKITLPELSTPTQVDQKIADALVGEEVDLSKYAHKEETNTFTEEQTFNGGITVIGENGICLQADGVTDDSLCTTIRGYTNGNGADETYQTDTTMKGDYNFVSNDFKITKDGVELITMVDVEAEGFVTSTVENLDNFYTKDETYTQVEIETLINNISTLNKEIVNELPTPENAKENVIYLLLKNDGTDDDVYDEYLLINGKLERIGSTQVNLSNYYTKEEVDTELETIQLAVINNANAIARVVDEDIKAINDEIDGIDLEIYDLQETATEFEERIETAEKDIEDLKSSETMSLRKVVYDSPTTFVAELHTDYFFGETTQIVVTLPVVTDEEHEAVIKIGFTSDEYSTSLVLPSDVVIPSDFEIEANKEYLLELYYKSGKWYLIKDVNNITTKAEYQVSKLFDITDQVDGANTTFIIEEDVEYLMLFYSGLLLFEGTDYTVDYETNILTTLFVPNTDEDRKLVYLSDTNIGTTTSGISEAPQDGKEYVRKNGQWVETTTGMSAEQIQTLIDNSIANAKIDGGNV